MHTEETASKNAQRTSADGFTLVEVLVAIVVLIFGMIAITNLFVVAGSSNVVARQMSAAAAQATEVMELLKATPFVGLAEGGDLDLATDASSTLGMNDVIDLDADDDATIDTYAADKSVDGVGVIRMRWRVVGVDAQTYLLKVVAAGTSPVIRARSRVELTTYRSCTAGTNLGCPE